MSASNSVLGEIRRFAGGRQIALPLVAAALVLDGLGGYPLITFAVSALAILPLAGLLGHATEELAVRVGPAAGGLLNATLGNLTELIIGVLALSRGEVEVVKASITGSIIGNLLLVFGLAALIGGLGRQKLSFSAVAVGANASMLFLAVVGLVMPALFQLLVSGSLQPSGRRIEDLSFWVSGVLLASYAASLVFILRTHRSLFRGEADEQPTLGRGAALALLAGSALLVAIASELLIGQIKAVTTSLGWTPLFVGLVVVATVGNAAEHSTAILSARAGRMDLALHIAVGSSTQIALFVAPLLVVLSPVLGAPMSLVFHPLEIAAVIFSVGAVVVVAMDGETNWLEGLMLTGVYAILGVFFYVLPSN
ncbi:MAG TPA: calcium/proton exchanger [Terriglobia bacterium]|nr:calcium/proton exchanger [Terriglobia bacterium]